MSGDKVVLPPTTLPCPPWCAMPAGHGFDSIDPADGTAWHSHERVIRDNLRLHGRRLPEPNREGPPTTAAVGAAGTLSLAA